MAGLPQGAQSFDSGDRQPATVPMKFSDATHQKSSGMLPMDLARQRGEGAAVANDMVTTDRPYRVAVGGQRVSVAMVGVLMAYETSNRTGTMHAVPLGDDLSLGGRRMLSFAGRPWPMARRVWPLEMRPCGECAREVFEEPQRGAVVSSSRMRHARRTLEHWNTDLGPLEEHRMHGPCAVPGNSMISLLAWPCGSTV